MNSYIIKTLIIMMILAILLFFSVRKFCKDLNDFIDKWNR